MSGKYLAPTKELFTFKLNRSHLKEHSIEYEGKELIVSWTVHNMLMGLLAIIPDLRFLILDTYADASDLII